MTRTKKQSTEAAVREIRRKTRRKFAPEEKVRIVLEGLRGEQSISELCRREGIAANLYYRWSKDFLEAGKKQLPGDTVREATSDEVKDLRSENRELKEVVAEITLKNRVLKTTTEDGAYTLTPGGIAGDTVTRNGGAKFFVPSEDEWYKAAYYKGGGTSAGYWDYPAGSNTATNCTTPGATANTANCNNFDDELFDVGDYTGSASPSGTFDQGGNVWEWNETILLGSLRGLRGGSFDFDSLNLAASEHDVFDPTFEASRLGFRVASPVPATPALSPLGLLVLAASLLGFFGYRQRRC